MIWADYVIIGVIVLSALVGLARGFVRETLSLIAWILAIWVALSFAPDFSGLLAGRISSPSLRLMAAFTVLFLGTLILAALINFLIVRTLDKAGGLGGIDNILGTLFGIARGVLVIAILVLLAGATPMPNDPWWRDSALIVYFEDMALWLRDFLPPDFAEKFVFAVQAELDEQ